MRTEKVPWLEAVGRHLPDNSYVGEAGISTAEGRYIRAFDLAEGWTTWPVASDGLIEVVVEDE